MFFFFSTHRRAGSRADFYLEGLGSVCLKMWQASSPEQFFFFFLLARKRVSGGERRDAPGSGRSAPVRLAQPSRRLQAPGQGSLLPHRDPDGDRPPSPFVCPPAFTPLRVPCRPSAPGDGHTGSAAVQQ